MRRITFLLSLLMLMCVAGFSSASASDITRMEYFYDSDPGIGSGTALTITQEASVSVTANLPLPANISEGIHYLYVRAMDSDGDWGFARVHPFYLHSLTPRPNITAAEYFIDNLVAEGQGTQIEVTPGTEATQTFPVNLGALSAGTHYLYIRAKDSRGVWGSIKATAFYILPAPVLPPNVTTIEYFVDTDPGYGLAKKVPITAGANPEGNFALDLAGLSVGSHTIEFRAMDANGIWSTVYNAQFEIKNAYFVTPSAGAGGTISPNTPQGVEAGTTKSFTVTPSAGYSIASVTGCGGALSGTTYTTGPVTADCAVTASFTTVSYTVTPSAGTGGSISPNTPQTVAHGATKTFTVTPSTGYSIASVTGCGGTLSGTTYTTGPVTADCSVTAIFTTVSYTVTPSAGTGGSISPNTPQTVAHGATKTFTVTPSTGYSIASVTGCGGTLSGTTYTTGPVTANCAVTASFTTVSYTVTPSAGANGSISPNTPQTVAHGATKSFTVTPDTGYSIASVTGCGGSLSGTTYTTGPVTANCAVTASFTTVSYTVTPSAGANGSISPNTPQTVAHGTTKSFTVTPSTGYSIASVTGCGGTLSGSTYTTGPVTADCAVTASFTTASYTVTPSAGANGSISPSTPQTVNHGTTKSFTVTPSTGYSIASVTGCGGTLSGGTYTTGSVTADCAVVASFKEKDSALPVIYNLLLKKKK